jgi:hypothetical protein
MAASMRLRKITLTGAASGTFWNLSQSFATTAQGGEKNVLCRFIAAAQKRFGRFA